MEAAHPACQDPGQHKQGGVLLTDAAALDLPPFTFSATACATAWAADDPPVLTASARALATAVPLPDVSALAMAVAAVLAAPDGSAEIAAGHGREQVQQQGRVSTCAESGSAFEALQNQQGDWRVSPVLALQHHALMLTVLAKVHDTQHWCSRVLCIKAVYSCSLADAAAAQHTHSSWRRLRRQRQRLGLSHPLKPMPMRRPLLLPQPCHHRHWHSRTPQPGPHCCLHERHGSRRRFC